MKRFKITDSNGGWQIIDAKDIFAAAVWAKKQQKAFFRTPVKIELVD